MRTLTIAVVVALALAACTGSTPAASTNPTTMVVTSPPSSPAGAIAPAGDAATVIRVIDGDSFAAVLAGDEVEVRLLGINAPEGSECFGDEARSTLEHLIESEEVTLVGDGRDADQYGRLLRYVYVDDLNINLALLADGDALALQGDHAADGQFAAISDAAAAARLGMWAPDACGAATIPGNIVVADYLFDPHGRDEDEMNNEWVAIANRDGDAVDMSGWMLRDESTQNRFRFPDGFSLSAGAQVTVHSGCGSDSVTDLFWCADDPVWSNGGDTVVLELPEGTVVARERYSRG